MNPSKSTAATVLMLLVLSVSSIAPAAAITVDLNALVDCAPPTYANKVIQLDEGWYVATLVQGTYTAWAYAALGAGNVWHTQYKIITFDGVDYVQWVGGAILFAGSAQEAFDQTSEKSLVFYQPVTGDIELRVADNDCWNNAGGVSLGIEECPDCAGVATEGSSWGSLKALYR